VRKAGTRLRITAQLINAGSGVSIWTDNYDREYSDVFAVQEDIATAIAGALRMPLGLKPSERLVNNRTNDFQAYENFLRVRMTGALARNLPNAHVILEQAIARDPNFAPAWASLAGAYRARGNVATRQSASVDEVRQVAQSWLDKAEMAARKTIELDPRLASGYGELATVQHRRGKWMEAESLYVQALAIDPDEPETLQGYSGLLMNIGRLEDALRMRESLLRLEPFVLIYNYVTAVTMHINGEDARAKSILEAIPPNLLSYNRNYALATLYAAEGQYAKAADTLLLINAQVPPSAVEEAARLLRTAPAKTLTPKDLPALQAELNFVYAHIGALERVMEYPERVVRVGNMGGGLYLIWDPLYAPLRKTERFKKLMRDAGIVGYWRAKGWPDRCRPVGADDFVCD
jgi:tetratricopeptide (TPR) repeat protein